MKHQFPGGREVYRGAEAVIYETTWLGLKAVVKVRLPKKYRSKELDERLRRGRTIAEAKTVLEALKHGIPVPPILYVDVENMMIVFEKIDGRLLRDLIDEEGVTPRILEIVEKVGEYTARLHEIDIVHGDLTTSNIIVSSNTPVFIDFGLSERSREELDKAIDVHLFLRSLESTHPEHVDILYKAFMKGYERVRGPDKTRNIEMMVSRIRSMGRYVEAKKRVKLVWGEHR